MHGSAASTMSSPSMTAKGSPPDEVLRLQHRVAQAERLLLPDVGDRDQLRDLRGPRRAGPPCRAPRASARARGDGVEVVLDRVLAAAGDDHDPLDARVARLLDDVLDRGAGRRAAASPWAGPWWPAGTACRGPRRGRRRRESGPFGECSRSEERLRGRSPYNVVVRDRQGNDPAGPRARPPRRGAARSGRRRPFARAAVVAAAAVGRRGARFRRRSVSRPASLYCGTSRGNFYGSHDAGATWEPLAPGPAFPGFYVTALVADPVVPGRLWASLAGELRAASSSSATTAARSWRPLLQVDGSRDDARARARSGAAAAARGRRRRRRAALRRRREDLDAHGPGRPGIAAGRVARLRSGRPPRPLRRHVAPGLPDAGRRRHLDADRRGHGPRRDGLRLGLRRRRRPRHLGLDLRLGLSVEGRRRPLDALHVRVHQPALARRAARPAPSRRRLRRDRRRPAPFRRRRRDAGRASRARRSSSPRSRSTGAPGGCTWARRARGLLFRRRRARRFSPARRA